MWSSHFVDKRKLKFSPTPRNMQARTRHDPVQLKVRLLKARDRFPTVTALAEHIKRPRPTVSAAINRGVFPRVLKEIEEALG